VTKKSFLTKHKPLFSPPDCGYASLSQKPLLPPHPPMHAPSDSSVASAMRRKILGLGGVAGVATLATYLGWTRNSTAPQASAPATPPHPAHSFKPHASEPVAEAPQQPVADTAFSRDAFVPHLNTDFNIIHVGDDSAQCRLIEVSAERRISSGKQTYAAFTLLFSAGPLFLRDGGICRVKHKAMGEMEFFLTPVGKPGAKTMLEAAFTQAV
jgi:hypothetical protein